jgi:hypothetical protein
MGIDHMTCDACGDVCADCDDHVRLEYPEDVYLCMDCMKDYKDCYETDSEDENHVASMPYSKNRLLMRIRDRRKALWQETDEWFRESRPCRSWRCKETVDGDWGKFCWEHTCMRKGCQHAKAGCMDENLCYNCAEIVRLGEILEVEYKTEEEFHQEIQDRKRKRSEVDAESDSASPDEKRVCVETANQ